jgi:hypothetical protein
MECRLGKDFVLPDGPATARRAARFSGFAEGVFEAGALWGEHLASVFSDVPVVFEADAEFASDVDAGFVGEAHAGDEWSVVAADEIGPLVAVHADAVAETVGEGIYKCVRG